MRPALLLAAVDDGAALAPPPGPSVALCTERYTTLPLAASMGHAIAAMGAPMFVVLRMDPSVTSIVKRSPFAVPASICVRFGAGARHVASEGRLTRHTSDEEDPLTLWDNGPDACDGTKPYTGATEVLLLLCTLSRNPEGESRAKYAPSHVYMNRCIVVICDVDEAGDDNDGDGDVDIQNNTGHEHNTSTREARGQDLWLGGWRRVLKTLLGLVY